MRLFVRATTVRAPTTTPGEPRIYAKSREGETSLARMDDTQGGLNSFDPEGEASSARPRFLRNDVEGEASRATAFIRALSREGEASFATPDATQPEQYAFDRMLVVEQQTNATATTIVDHVVRGLIVGDWLKQSNLTGGRIRSPDCYDLIFETTAASPVRLDHEIDIYDGTAGSLQVALRLPSWVSTSSQFLVRIRYGATL